MKLLTLSVGSKDFPINKNFLENAAYISKLIAEDGNLAVLKIGYSDGKIYESLLINHSVLTKEEYFFQNKETKDMLRVFSTCAIITSGNWDEKSTDTAEFNIVYYYDGTYILTTAYAITYGFHDRKYRREPCLIVDRYSDKIIFVFNSHQVMYDHGKCSYIGLMVSETRSVYCTYYKEKFLTVIEKFFADVAEKFELAHECLINELNNDD